MLAAAAVAAALAGCGGGSRPPATTETHAGTTVATTPAPAPTRRAVTKAAYVARMRALGRTLGDEIGRIYPISTGAHGSAMESATVRRLEQARTVIEQVLAEVRSMRPPAAVAADERRLEQGLAGVAAELGQAAADIRRGDFEASLTPSRLLDLRLVTSATTGMEQKGYDVLGTRTG